MLDRLRKANLDRDLEWDPEAKITIGFRGLELIGEVGELCNLLKKLERERIGIRGSRATINEVIEELADVVICADLIAMHLNIDLEEAIKNKFNDTSRKYALAARLI